MVGFGDGGEIALEVRSGDVGYGLAGDQGSELREGDGGGGGPPSNPRSVGAIDAGLADVRVVEDGGQALTGRIGDRFLQGRIAPAIIGGGGGGDGGSGRVGSGGPSPVGRQRIHALAPIWTKEI
uniref:Uncharacterized protein MANES_03G070100 n=1 Tax=Rhizophora mucronata TaxID=61149 RepID=A0A2P2M9Q8_RHIMU